MQKENHFEELYDRVQKTANSRFFAHDRLRHHQSVSLWTITCFSMGLIFVPLIQTFGLEARFSTAFTSFTQVVLAIVILVISVLLNMANFAVRADRIHQCGMVLNALARKIHRHINEKTEGEDYDSLVKDYDHILQKYENHSRIDYLFTKNHMTNYYKNPWYFPIYIRGLYLIQFLPYIFLLGFEIVWIYLMVTPKT